MNKDQEWELLKRLANKNMNKKARLRSKADRLWFEHNLRDKCEICGNKAIQVHHFYYKRNYPHLRYDDDNGISLCKGCHFVLHHQDPKKITEQIISKRGDNWYKFLKEKAQNKPRSFESVAYYREIINNLEK